MMKTQKREIIGLCLLGLAAAMFVFPIITRPVQAASTLKIQVWVTLLKRVDPWPDSTGEIYCTLRLGSPTIPVSGEFRVPVNFVPVSVGQSRYMGDLTFSRANPVGCLTVKAYDQDLFPNWLWDDDDLLYSGTFSAGQSNTFYAGNSVVQVKLQITWT
jgi:hypothetical protein